MLQIDAPEPQNSIRASGSSLEAIRGTVTDTNEDIVPGATVILDSQTPADRRTTTANDDGEFTFIGLKPGVDYHVTIQARGFEDWASSPVHLAPGQEEFLTGIELVVKGDTTSVTVFASRAQLATQQVLIEEQQRVLGFIPNYYVVYDKNAVPLTAKLKFELALKVSIDPINFVGAGFYAAMGQAGRTPDYPEGAKGFGERFGATYADGLTDLMFGGAILPTLLQQDPRYYYQGTGTTRSRLMHAIAYPFVCEGDNRKLQPNYSTIGGDLISSAMSNLYYPRSNRGVNMLVANLAINTGERTVSSLLQEFVLRRLTPKARQAN